MKLLEEDQHNLVIEDDDESVKVFPKTHYFSLKYAKFKGERIIVERKRFLISETYNDGIFNLVWKVGKKELAVQTQKIHQDNVANAVTCLLENRTDEIHEIVTMYLEQEINREFMIDFLKQHKKRVKPTRNGGYFVDNMWHIDDKGMAGIIKGDIDKNTEMESVEWSSLCIVVKDTKTFLGNLGRGSTHSPQVNKLTHVVLAKIFFLLNADLYLNGCPHCGFKTQDKKSQGHITICKCRIYSTVFRDQVLNHDERYSDNKYYKILKHGEDRAKAERFEKAKKERDEKLRLHFSDKTLEEFK